MGKISKTLLNALFVSSTSAENLVTGCNDETLEVRYINSDIEKSKRCKRHIDSRDEQNNGAKNLKFENFTLTSPLLKIGGQNFSILTVTIRESLTPTIRAGSPQPAVPFRSDRHVIWSI